MREVNKKIQPGMIEVKQKSLLSFKVVAVVKFVDIEDVVADGEVV